MEPSSPEGRPYRAEQEDYARWKRIRKILPLCYRSHKALSKILAENWEQNVVLPKLTPVERERYLLGTLGPSENRAIHERALGTTLGDVLDRSAH
jgi:hypothetical protein